MGWLLLALVALVPCDDPFRLELEDRVDLIEVNHFYDPTGKLVFDQLIFYDWSEENQQFEIRDYKLLRQKNHRPVAQTIQSGYVTAWHDDHMLRVVKGSQLVETWTQFDPENKQRQFVPSSERTGLLRQTTIR